MEERWPTLSQFLGHCHEDWPELYETVEKAIDAAISSHSLDSRQQALRDWRDCNVAAATGQDIRSLLNDGFGVNVHFEQPIDARNFWNSTYDKLIVSVRSEVGKDWKP